MDIQRNEIQHYGGCRYRSREMDGAAKTRRTEEIRTAIKTDELKDITPERRMKGIDYLNNVMRTAGKLVQPGYSALELGKLLILNPEDQAILQATKPNKNDNEQAGEIRSQYKELADGIQKDVNHAKNLVRKLGPGTHTLTDKNGQPVATVTVKTDAKTGETSVSINNKDGSVSDINYNRNKHSSCTVEKTSPEGEKTVTRREGTKCERESGGIRESYDTRGKGAVTKEVVGPGSDDFQKTIANSDGSTDEYNLIYNDENGEPVYDHNHEEGKETDVSGYRDAGAGKAIEDLKKANPDGNISDKEMIKLIVGATNDMDGEAAGKEYEDLKGFMEENWNRLSDEAKEKWQVYENYARTSKANGESGIVEDEYNKMLGELYGRQSAQKAKPDLNPPAPPREEIHPDPGGGIPKPWPRPTPGEIGPRPWPGLIPDFPFPKPEVPQEYLDESSGNAIDALNKINPDGEIDGKQMEKLVVDATGDADGEAAGKEYGDLQRFIEENWNRLSDEAKEKWLIYENYARTSKANGESGIPADDYEKMKQEMQAADKESY